MGEDHQATVDKEVIQIQQDIKRLGQKNENGQTFVPFGVLFDDHDVQGYYEALVGTLRAAKKRGIIDFKGQMLLKGAHDNVAITMLNDTKSE